MTKPAQIEMQLTQSEKASRRREVSTPCRARIKDGVPLHSEAEKTSDFVVILCPHFLTLEFPELRQQPSRL